MPSRLDASGFLRSIRHQRTRIHHAGMTSVQDATRAAYDKAKGTTLFKDRTGQLRASIESFDTGAFSGKVQAGAPYAPFIENGTRAHTIYPVNGPFLVFMVNGTRVFARKVNHPGTAKRPFMAQAKEAGSRVFVLATNDRMRRALS